jgi:hypothetical protein
MRFRRPEKYRLPITNILLIEHVPVLAGPHSRVGPVTHIGCRDHVIGQKLLHVTIIVGDDQSEDWPIEQDLAHPLSDEVLRHRQEKGFVDRPYW